MGYIELEEKKINKMGIFSWGSNWAMEHQDDPRIQPEEFVWKSEFDEVDEIEENKKSTKKTALANLKNGSKNEDLVTSRTDGESSKNENDSADGPSSESTQTSYFGMISNSFNSWFRVKNIVVHPVKEELLDEDEGSSVDRVPFGFEMISSEVSNEARMKTSFKDSFKNNEEMLEDPSMDSGLFSSYESVMTESNKTSERELTTSRKEEIKTKSEAESYERQSLSRSIKEDLEAKQRKLHEDEQKKRAENERQGIEAELKIKTEEEQNAKKLKLLEEQNRLKAEAEIRRLEAEKKAAVEKTR